MLVLMREVTFWFATHRPGKVARVSKERSAGRRSILRELQLANLARQQPDKKSRLQQLRQQLQQQHFLFDHHEQLTLPPISPPPAIPSSPVHEPHLEALPSFAISSSTSSVSATFIHFISNYISFSSQIFILVLI